MSNYNKNLDKNNANYVPLTPLSFLERTKDIYPNYSIPMVGAVINAINTRLDSKTISYILNHSDAKVLIVDRQFHEIINRALENVKNKITIIDIIDKDIDNSNFKQIGKLEYESFLKTGDDTYETVLEIDREIMLLLLREARSIKA